MGILLDIKATNLRRAITAALGAIVVAVGSGCGAPPAQQAAAIPAWRAESLTGVPGGFRATAYDAMRDRLWILTRYFHQAGVPLVDLTQFDIATGSTASPLKGLSGSGFIKGSLEVDSAGKVWMTWGRSLIRYDYVTNSTQSWTLPALPPDVEVLPEHPGLDGNAVGMAINGNQIWLVANSVEAVFRFNISLSKWDKYIKLPLAPNLMSRLTFSSSEELGVNGVDASRTPIMAIINASTGTVAHFQTHVIDYAVLGDGRLVFADDEQNLDRLDSSAAGPVRAATGLPFAGRPYLVFDRTGNLWFSMSAYKSVGIAELSMSTGQVMTFPFPQPTTAPTGALTCPGPSFGCNSSLVFDPDVQTILVDSRNNIWVTTSVPGLNGDPNFTAPAAALYELPDAG